MKRRIPLGKVEDNMFSDTLIFKDPVIFVRVDFNKKSADYISSSEAKNFSKLLDFYADNGGFDYYFMNGLFCIDINVQSGVWYLAHCYEEGSSVFVKSLDSKIAQEIVEEIDELETALTELLKNK